MIPASRLLIGLLLAASLALPAAALPGPPEPSSTPCSVKLRSGRVLQADALMPVDDARAFWRLELRDGGAVVLPVREIKSVMTVAGVPLAPLDEPQVADAEPESMRGGGRCDPATSKRLLRWESLAAASAAKHGLDPALVRSIIAVESCGEADAVSPKGAVGLMQLMPATAMDYGCEDPSDPAANVETGCRHFARLMRRMNGDVRLALAAYNAGEGAVAKADGIPAFRETRRYVKQVLAHHVRLSTTKPTS